jgi:glycosyltransferase involved in cell wall biosynthesis
LILLIDASNINAGGGITHLSELLRAAQLDRYDFTKVLIWAPQKTLDKLEYRPWLVKKTDPILEKSYVKRAIWQSRHLDQLAKSENCDLIFVPGGTFVCKFRPVVSMSQNLLPFDMKASFRYGFSPLTVKFIFLRIAQTLSFRKANGTIFLTEYAKNAVLKVTGRLKGAVTVVPHGIDERFFIKPRPQYPVSHYTMDDPFRILYVSTIEPYKHQCEVISAVARLRGEGLPVVLDLIGAAYPPALEQLKKEIVEADRNGVFINYLGLVAHTELSNHYRTAQLSVFASTCETFGQILLEGMAAGLPTACSKKSAMPEILEDAGVYFDAENVESITNVIREFITSAELMTEKAEAAYQKAQKYSWNTCAHKTFLFLAEIAKQHKTIKSNITAK